MTRITTDYSTRLSQPVYAASPSSSTGGASFKPNIVAAATDVTSLFNLDDHRGEILPASTFYGDPREVAQRLLGKTLVYCKSGITYVVMIDKTAPYGGNDDPDSYFFREVHGHKTMAEPPGTVYVSPVPRGLYLNVVAHSGNPGDAGCVFIKAAKPLHGIEEMRRNRKRELDDSKKDDTLCNGPINLSKAMAITRDLNGLRFTDTEGNLVILNAPEIPRDQIRHDPREGDKLQKDKTAEKDTTTDPSLQWYCYSIR